ncbi:Uncharacterised protein [Citrobacter youngae]|nr:Uncharacterised protein [Citrobacter youngae]
MSKGQQPAYPCPRIDTPRDMTYRQHLVVQIAPVMLTNFLAMMPGRITTT